MKAFFYCGGNGSPLHLENHFFCARKITHKAPAQRHVRMQGVLDTYTGGMPSRLKVVYKFDGERSADVDAFTSETASRQGWTQRHNPFLGSCAPSLFLQSLEEWSFNNDFVLELGAECVYHDIFYAVPEKNDGGAGIVFSAASDVVGSVASEYLKLLAVQVGSTYVEVDDVTAAYFSPKGFCFGATFSVCFFALAPNTFSESTPYECCDGHRVVSALDAYLTQLENSSGGSGGSAVTAATGLHPFLFQPLQSAHHVSCHNELWEMEYGGFYREMLDFKAGKRGADVAGPALRELSYQSRGASPFLQTLKGQAAVNILNALHPSARARCFSGANRGGRKSVVSFYKKWLEDAQVNPGVWSQAVRQLFYSSVPLDAGAMLLRDVFATPSPCVCAELKLLFLTTTLRHQRQAASSTLLAVLKRIGCGMDLLPLISGFVVPCNEGEQVEGLAWNRLDVLLEDVVSVSLTRGKILSWTALTVRFVISNLRALSAIGATDKRVPAGFWDAVPAACETHAAHVRASICLRLLEARAHPIALLKGLFAVPPGLRGETLQVFMERLEPGLLKAQQTFFPFLQELVATIHTGLKHIAVRPYTPPF